MGKINILIVDDSAIVRQILSDNFKKNNHFGIVHTAVDPYNARNKIARNEYNVLILDIEMPRMDGLTFLKYLMKSYPLPVLILSSLTDSRNEASMKALELGAIDIVPKPGGPYSVGNVINTLIEKTIAAFKIDFEKVKKIALKNISTGSQNKIKYLSKIRTTNKFIVIGASTGGPNALEILFKSFNNTFPPTACVIHMPEKFTYSFAKRLDSICTVNVKEAENNEKAETGCVYIAPGNYHLKVKLVGANKILKVVKGPQINHQRPSVDILFNSVAENIGRNCIGALLTGMGKDGAEGLLNIKNNGGYTIAQDEVTSIVFGMPKEAIEMGAADKILPVGKIANAIARKLE